MVLEVDAVYQNGILRLPGPLPLTEGVTVRVTIHPVGNPVKRLAGLVPWKGDLKELDSWLNDPDEGQVGEL